MGAYKYYNPSTEQWEIIKSKSIIKDDGSLEYTPDDIQEIDNKIGILSGAGEPKEKANKEDLETHKADNVAHGNVIGRVENTEYNIYQLMLQKYYEGKSLYKKGLFFDGFIDESVIDRANSTVNLDTTSKKLANNNTKYIDKTTGSGSTSIKMGDASNTLGFGQSFNISEKIYLSAIQCSIWRTGNPTDDLIFKLSNAGANGIPTSVLKTITVSPSSIPTSYGLSMIDLNIELTAGNYVFTMERSGSVDSSNYYNYNYFNTSGYPSGNYVYKPSPAAWAYDTSRDLPFALYTAISDTTNKVYQTKEQILSQEINNSTLYMTMTDTNGTTVTPEISIGDTLNFNSMILDNVITLQDGKKEYKFKYSSPISGNKIKIRLNISNTRIVVYNILQIGCILGVS